MTVIFFKFFLISPRNEEIFRNVARNSEVMRVACRKKCQVIMESHFTCNTHVLDINSKKKKIVRIATVIEYIVHLRSCIMENKICEKYKCDPHHALFAYHSR